MSREGAVTHDDVINNIFEKNLKKYLAVNYFSCQ